MSYFKTPGVYIKEQDAFGSSVVAVPTAVPVFIGHTQRAERDGNSLLFKPTKVKSLAEYREIFGQGPTTTFKVGKNETGAPTLEFDAKTRFMLFSGLRLFYSNGGGECYILSVGTYNDELDPEKFGEALGILTKEQEPTIVCVPDAVLFGKDDCYSLYKDILQHCGAKMRSRVAVVDVWNGYDVRTKDKAVQDFRENIGQNQLAWGAVYYPWVHTTVVPASEVDFRNISNRKDFAAMLFADIKSAMGISGGGEENAKNLAAANKVIDGIKDEAGIDAAIKKLANDKITTKEKDVAKAQAELKKAAAAAYAGGGDPADAGKLAQIEAAVNQVLNDDSDPKVINSTVGALSPLYKVLMKNIREELNLLPPSAAMCGVYSLVDSQEGVHKAPANVSLNSVVRPAFPVNSDDQEDLNAPLSGKAINAIRSFVGKGVLVWGARSMDANSQDWRYISVRRTLIMIEQSIKNSVEAYVFEPNTARTWLKLKTSIDNFLTEVWKNGSLAGATPSQAFEVNVGLGSTMTPNDILEGIMRVSIKVAITRPAEFIEITFEQKMQES
ncbi:MAG: phage tail sheath C-terminal domain-containing protein [Bacteroidia bacterium]